MALSGMTTIEFSRRFYLIPGDNMYDFSYDKVKDNLFIIFGTNKWLRVLSPSLRALPLSGIEFSFKIKEDGYDEDGYLPIKFD